MADVRSGTAAPARSGIQFVKLLKDIALIRAGVPFRGKVEPEANGRYHLVQIKDVDRNRGLRLDSLMRMDAPEVRESQHLLEPGDVLFVARGLRNDAVLFPGPMANAVAGAQFFVIRPTTIVVPAYLAWYLNQETAQRHIAEYVSGSFVPFVPKAALDELEVLLPPVEDQRKIAAIQQLAMKEQELLDGIKAKRRIMTEALLRRSIEQVRFADHMAKEYQ
jgi:hypothetical protein